MVGLGLAGALDGVFLDGDVDDVGLIEFAVPGVDTVETVAILLLVCWRGEGVGVTVAVADK